METTFQFNRTHAYAIVFTVVVCALSQYTLFYSYCPSSIIEKKTPANKANQEEIDTYLEVRNWILDIIKMAEKEQGDAYLYPAGHELINSSFITFNKWLLKPEHEKKRFYRNLPDGSNDKLLLAIIYSALENEGRNTEDQKIHTAVLCECFHRALDILDLYAKENNLIQD